jgi:hypothetical protein
MKLLREPLLHFAVAGALLFGLFGWLNRDKPDALDANHTIRITERELTWLADTSTRAWQRAPDEAEFQGLIADYLREELLAREARAFELDRDDTIVRRRLAQKMSFVLESTARLATPSDAQLRAMFEAEQSKFSTPARSTFQQVYFSAEKRGPNASADARAALVKLAHGAYVDSEKLGDASLLPETLNDADQEVIAGRFDAEFAHAVATISPGTWQGPIESGYGQHLVLVTAHNEGQPRTFEEVRGELLEEWQRQQEAKAKAAYFSGLLRKYDVQATPEAQHLLAPALELLKGTP